MEYKKKIYLKGLIFSKDELKKIAKVLFDKLSNENSKIDIKFYFDDHSEILGHDLLIFESDFLDEKNLNEVEIFFFDSAKFETTINIDINNSEFSKSFISVKSLDETIYLSAIELFNQRIQNVKKQNIMYVPLNNFLFLNIAPAIITMFLIFLLINIPILKESSFLILVCFIVLILTYLVFDKMKKLFPLIEFQFGNKNFKKNKLKKMLALLLKYLVGLIIPILIQIYIL